MSQAPGTVDGSLLGPTRPALGTDVLLRDIQDTMRAPFVPNFMTVQAASTPVLTSTYRLVEHILIGGRLPRPLKEMMLIAISQARGCAYCSAAHMAFCKMLGVDEATLTNLAHDIDSLEPPRSRELVRFAVECAMDPQADHSERVARLRAEGCDDPEILEAVALAGFATYVNIIADATRVPLDGALLHE